MEAPEDPAPVYVPSLSPAASGCFSLPLALLLVQVGGHFLTAGTPGPLSVPPGRHPVRSQSHARPACPLAGAGPCGGAVSPGKEAPETEGILLALACRLPVLGPGAGFYPHFMALKIPLLFYFILLNKEEVIHER